MLEQAFPQVLINLHQKPFSCQRFSLFAAQFLGLMASMSCNLALLPAEASAQAGQGWKNQAKVLVTFDRFCTFSVQRQICFPLGRTDRRSNDGAAKQTGGCDRAGNMGKPRQRASLVCKPKQIFCSDVARKAERDPPELRDQSDSWNVEVTKQSDILILAVKPQVM
jgi:hypothetical protein